jgi:hypothetical protein
MGMQTAVAEDVADSFRLSGQFVHAARTAIAQLRTLDTLAGATS